MKLRIESRHQRKKKKKRHQQFSIVASHKKRMFFRRYWSNQLSSCSLLKYFKTMFRIKTPPFLRKMFQPIFAKIWCTHCPYCDLICDMKDTNIRKEMRNPYWECAQVCTSAKNIWRTPSQELLLPSVQGAFLHFSLAFWGNGDQSGFRSMHLTTSSRALQWQAEKCHAELVSEPKSSSSSKPSSQSVYLMQSDRKMWDCKDA